MNKPDASTTGQISNLVKQNLETLVNAPLLNCWFYFVHYI
jgi:hypothetical protein